MELGPGRRISAGPGAVERGDQGGLVHDLARSSSDSAVSASRVVIPRRSSPAKRPAASESPAPTVSTTDTRGMSRRINGRPGGRRAGRAPSVMQDQRGAALGPDRGPEVEVGARVQPGEVLGADLHDVGVRHEALQPGADGVGVVAQRGPHRSLGQRGADVGVDADKHPAADPFDQARDGLAAGRRPAGDGSDVQHRRRLRERGGELVVRPLPVGGARDVEAVVGGAVGAQADHGEAHRLGRGHEAADVDAGLLGVPAQGRGQRAGAEAGQQGDGRPSRPAATATLSAFPPGFAT